MPFMCAEIKPLQITYVYITICFENCCHPIADQAILSTYNIDKTIYVEERHKKKINVFCVVTASNTEPN